MNCCLKILHINLHILYILYIKTSSRMQELLKYIKYIKSYRKNNFIIFVSLVFYVVLHLNLKKLRFTGEPMTQRTCQSRGNVNHVRM